MRSFILKIVTYEPATASSWQFLSRLGILPGEEVATIGMVPSVLHFSAGDHFRVLLQLWVLSDNERFAVMRESYLLGTLGVVLLFDPGQPSTWERLVEWHEEVLSTAGAEIPVLVVSISNPAEQDTEPVDPQEVESFVADRKCLFVESRLGGEIDSVDVFGGLIQKVLAGPLEELGEQVTITAGSPPEPAVPTQTPAGRLPAGSYHDPSPVPRRACPKCGNTNPRMMREIPDKTQIINSYPLIYGKKYVCGQCGTEWKPNSA